MKTVKEITGLEMPKFEEYLEEQERNGEGDCYDAYISNLEAYAFSLENYITKEEQKKEGNINIIYNDLKDIGELNERAINLNCDIYLMLEEALGVNFCKTNQNIYDAVHEQWYDVLHKQERIIMGLQNCLNSINKKETENND